MSKRDPALLINDILESCNKILQYTSSMNFEEFLKDSKTIDAVIAERTKVDSSQMQLESGEELIGGSTNLNEIESVIADSIVLQQFAMLLAIKNGLNPDAPTGLLKVTQTI